MTLILPTGLPAITTLSDEGISITTAGMPINNNLKTLNVALLNLMPNKMETEVQIMRMLSVSNFNIKVHLLNTSSYRSKNTSAEYLNSFYKNYKAVEEQIDGLIITGAAVELMEFEEVNYWEELKEIMDWSKKKVKSTFFICWAAQAGLFHHYRIGKRKMKAKLSGIFPFELRSTNPLIAHHLKKTNFVPHSRYTEICQCKLENIPELKIVSASAQYGVDLIISKDGKQVFATGHSEYDAWTLKDEYFRDLTKGLKPSIPLNYFPGNKPNNTPIEGWRAYGKQLFSNWIQFYVNN